MRPLVTVFSLWWDLSTSVPVHKGIYSMVYKLPSLTHFFKRGINCPVGSFVWMGLVSLRCSLVCVCAEALGGRCVHTSHRGNRLGVSVCPT